MPQSRLAPQNRIAARLLATATLALSCAVTAGCHESHAQPNADAAALVRVTHPSLSETVPAEYSGTVHARIESDLGFRVAGKIVERLVDPGQIVHRGQALITLDPTNLSLASLAAHQRLQAAKAEATRAMAEETRQQSLLAEGAISVAVYETGLAAAHATAANTVAAEAAARDADLQRDYATLTANADGLVMEVLAQPGQVVQPGTLILRLAQAGPREALVAIPESAVANVAKEGVARVQGGSRSYPVRLRELSGAADAVTRTFAARYSIEAPLEATVLGSTITLTLNEPIAHTLQVPLASLHDGGRGVGVWVVTPDGVARFRPVSIKALGQETAELAPGTLTSNDVIVALGAHLLREGDRVRVLKDPI
jgi:RND family efflux transporter MFP subunit